MPEARMDGTPAEQLLWRVSALREAMQDALTMDHAGTMQQVIRNALGVDDYNAETMKKSERGGCQ